MNELSAGTLCFLTGITPLSFLNGRVVTVARRVPGDELVYQVVADWIPYVFPGSEMHTGHRNLLPIVPPPETVARTEAVA